MNDLSKKIIEDLKQKILDIKQIDAQMNVIRKIINVNAKKAEYGSIGLIDKKYYQFVGQSVKGSKQKKVYIGKDLKKLKHYQDAINFGKIEKDCVLNHRNLYEELKQFDLRLNPKYF